MASQSRYHYIPQFYLRRFATDSNARQIATFSISSSRFVAVASIKKQGQHGVLGNARQREPVLSLLEAGWSPLFTRIIDESYLPRPGSADYGSLMHFVAMQIARTPAAGKQFNESLRGLSDVILDLNGIKPEDPEWASIVHTDAIGESIGAALFFPLALLDLSLVFLRAPRSIRFITSDNPVAHYNYRMQRHPGGVSHTGLASAGLQLFVPISPRVSMCLYDGRVYKIGGRNRRVRFLEINEDSARELNLLQMWGADDLVFTSNANDIHDMEILAQKVKPLRPAATSSISLVSEMKQSSGGRSLIYKTSKVDPALDLQLQFCKTIPSRHVSSLRSNTINNRNDEWLQIIFEFRRAVGEGRYSINDIWPFVDEYERQKLAKARMRHSIG